MTPWNKHHQRELQKAQETIRNLAGLRAKAIEHLIEVMRSAGCEEFNPEGLVVWAKAIRDALEPFDDGDRPAEVVDAAEG